MELRANELRIGNLVSRLDLGDHSLRVESVLELKKDKVLTTGPISVICLYSEIKPIPLTEEWLLKFGFKNIDSAYTIDNDRFEFSFIFYDAWNLYYKEKKGFGCDEINLTGFWNIHQLQNLYFALTGEELSIK